MNSNLPQKELIIAVIENGDEILMRKKPNGSEPHKETWYLFGCERVPNQDDAITLWSYLKIELCIDVDVSKELIPPAFEIKKDHDGIEKNFIYLNMLCQYLNGTPKVPAGAERVEWIPKSRLKDYDIVPPSVALFKNLNYF